MKENKAFKGLKYITLLAMAILMVFTVAACNTNVSFESTDITYDGERIAWKSVSKAEHYLVSINGGQEEKLTSTSMSYTMTGNFTVDITVVLKKSELSASRSFTLLPQVANVRVDERTIRWDESEGAENYVVMINSVRVATIQQTHFELRASDLGNLSIKVLATTGTTSLSKWSTILSVNALRTPENIKFNGTQISWNSVSGATGYNIVVNDGTPKIATSSPYNFDAEQKDVSIKIQATGGSNTIDSFFSEPVDYFYLAPITTFAVTDGVLTWLPIENATSYDIKVGNNVTTVTEPRYSGMNPGSSYNISVFPKAEGKNYFSQWSVAETINILAIPTNIRYSSNQLMWNPVSSATGYRVEIHKDGVVQNPMTLEGNSITAIDLVSYTNEAGEYKFTIQATTATPSYFNSPKSEAATIIRLNAPSGHTITDNPTQEFSTTVTINPVANASAYEVLSDDVEIEGFSGTTFKIGLSKNLVEGSTQTINFKIRSIGSENTATKTWILPSTEVHSFDVTRLATPSNVRASNGKLLWDAVGGASGYVFSLDTATTSEVNSSDTEVPAHSMTAGTHKLYVRARGNGSNILSSPYVSIDVQKLATPTNVRFTSGKNLTWVASQGCSGYKVLINSNPANPELITGNTFNVSEELIATSGVAIGVIAVGDGAALFDSDQSVVIDVIRLEAPTNISLRDNVIDWNAPSNKGNNTVSYDVYIGGQLTETSVASNSSWSTRGLNIGDNVITIVARGDNMKAFDSAVSASVTIKKLAPVAPVISADKTGISWQAIVNAQAYGYRVGSGEKKELANSVLSLSFKGLVTADTTVYVWAKGSDTQNICTSEETAFAVDVEALNRPLNVTKSYNSETQKLTVTVNDYNSPLENQKFEFNFGGTSLTPEGNSAEYSATLGSTISYDVVAVGGFFAGNVYYVNSQKSETGSATFLARPELNELMVLTGGGRQISWSANNATRFTYTVELLDSSGNVLASETKTNDASTSYNIASDKMTDVATIRITIFANSANQNQYNSPTVVREYTI